MLTCTRSIGFDAGHRIVGHEGKCRNLHGHRYTAEITCSAPLDPLGRVIDFSKIKTVVGGWIDLLLDHNMILFKNDPLYAKLDPATLEEVCGREPYMVDFNPTAENLARFLFNKAQELLDGYGIKVVHVRLFETPNCWADYDHTKERRLAEGGKKY